MNQLNLFLYKTTDRIINVFMRPYSETLDINNSQRSISIIFFGSGEPLVAGEFKQQTVSAVSL
jgi:hypothetical protein